MGYSAKSAVAARKGKFNQPKSGYPPAFILLVRLVSAGNSEGWGVGRESRESLSVRHIHITFWTYGNNSILTYLSNIRCHLCGNSGLCGA